MENEPKMGDRAICALCGKEIEYVGPYWRHTGEIQPRHPATPKVENQAPLQPGWTRELDSREWSQVLHAQAYARNHQGAGAPGHGQFLLIAKLARLLDEHESHEQGAQL